MPQGLKIFVDDLREAPEGWHLCRTITDAIRTIATAPGEIEVISLDHDIGSKRIGFGCYACGEVNAEEIPCDETFEPVAYYIAERWHTLNGYGKPVRLFPKIIIHSGNPVAAQRMADILKEFYVTIEPRV